MDPNYEFLETGTWNTPTELFGGQQEQASKETTILEEIERIEDLVPPVRRTLKLVEVGDGKFETPPSTREYPEKEVPSRSIVSMRHEANVLAELLSMRDVQPEELDRERDRLMLALEKGTWTYNPKEENVDKMFEETIPSKDDLRETVLLEIVSSDDVSTSEEDEDVLLLEEVEEQPPPLPDDEGDEEVVEKTPPVVVQVEKNKKPISKWWAIGIFTMLFYSYAWWMVDMVVNDSQPTSPPSTEISSFPSQKAVITFTHCHLLNNDRPVGMDGRPIVICDEGVFTATATWKGGGVVNFSDFTPYR